MDDPGLIESLQFIGPDIRFLTGGKISASDIIISYPDNSGTRTVQQSVPVFGGPSTTETVTHTGSVGIQGEFGINRDVTITLIDPDLDMDSDVIDVYRVVDDPTSPYVDTVGHAQDGWLLEVLIKGTRYQRCLISDQIHGGLGSTGFVMIETARDSGVFQGSFKIPQWICSSDGTSLVSPAGGSIVARYNDFADSLGDSTVTTSLTQHSAWLPPQLGSSTLEAPPPGQTASVTIQGIVPGHLSGSAVEITVTDPAGMDYILQLTPSKQGIYSGSITVPPSILLGTYAVHVEYLGATLGDLSLTVTEERLPYWMKDLAEEWSAGNVPDVEFVAGLEHLAMRGVLSDISPSVHEMPSWVRVLAGWWSTGHVTDDAFVASVEYLITTGLIGS